MTPFSTAAEVDQVAQAAAKAFESWRRTPATERIQYLFKLNMLMEENFLRPMTLDNVQPGTSVASYVLSVGHCEERFLRHMRCTPGVCCFAYSACNDDGRVVASIPSTEVIQ